MFDRLKSKFHSVQENFTASIRGLSAGDSTGRSQLHNVSPEVNLSAGTDLLEHYQACWAELHEAAQENASKAQEVDHLIGKLHKRLQKQTRDIGQTGTILTRLPEVIHLVNELSEKIEALGDLFDAVEIALIQFEDLLETRELQDRQLDHRFQLALYKEKKLSMLENFRVTLAEKHAEKIRKHELKQQRLMKERQDAFADQFKCDMAVYKETSKISKINKATHHDKLVDDEKENTLEDVKLEADDNTLDDFLKDSIPDPS